MNRHEKEDAVLGAGVGCGCLVFIIAAKLLAVAAVVWVAALVLRAMGAL